jgi:hypothetical protein
MKPEDQMVDVLDEHGQIKGQKRRREVDKNVDIYHGVHVVLVTPAGEAILSLIPQRDDLPNLYTGMLGSTVATIRRHNETNEQAAKRALYEDLLLDARDLKQVRDGFIKLADGHFNHLTAFTMVSDRPELYQELHVGELIPIEPEGLDAALAYHTDRFAPTLRVIWPALRARRR